MPYHHNLLRATIIFLSPFLLQVPTKSDARPDTTVPTLSQPVPSGGLYLLDSLNFINQVHVIEKSGRKDHIKTDKTLFLRHTKLTSFSVDLAS